MTFKWIFSQKIRKAGWWAALCLAVMFSCLGTFIFSVVFCLSAAPLDISRAGKYFAGNFYLNEDGELTQKTENAVGRLEWDSLKIQWIMPGFSNWFSQRNIGDIAFDLSKIRLVDLQNKEIDRLNDIRGKIAVSPLAKGKVAICSLEAEGLAFHLKKLKTGQVILDFPGVHQNTKPQKPLDLSFLNRDFLHEVRLENLDLTLLAEAEKQTAKFTIPQFYLENKSKSRALGKWEGIFRISAQNGRAEAAISGTRKEEANWRMKVDLPVPQDFQAFLPVMGKIHLPLQSEISGKPILCLLGQENCNLSFNISVGKGYYLQPDGSKMQVAKAFGEGNVSWLKNYKKLQAKVTNLDVDWIDAFGAPTKEYLHAALDLDNLAKPRQTSLSIGGSLPQFNIGSLPTLWPQGLANGARKWIVENLTEGKAENFALEVDLGGEQGFDHLKVRQMGGELTAKNVTVHWLKGMPAFKGVGVSAKFLDADNVLVKMTGGVIDETPHAPVMLSEGSVAIRGVTTHEKQIAGTIRLGLSGSVPKLVEILSRDNLPILKRFQKYYTNPKGTFDGNVMLDFPFAPWITADNILFETTIQAHQMAAKLKEIGQVDHFNGVLKAENKALTVQSKAFVRNIPVEMDLYHNLTANKPGQEMLAIHFASDVNQNFLRKIGIPLSAERITGQGRLEADFSQPWTEKNHSETNLRLNLNMTGAAVDSLLWRKALKVPAGGSLEAFWKDGDLVSLTNLKAYGPDIEIHAETLLENHRIRGIDVSHLKIGRNEGRFRFEWPVETSGLTAAQKQKLRQDYVLNVNASKIDLAPFLAHTSTEVKDTLKGRQIPEAAKPVIKQKNGRIILPEGNWQMDVKVEKAFLGKGRILGPVSVFAHWHDRHLKKADIEIQKPYKASFRVFYNKNNQKEHLFEGKVAHLGEWLSWGKVYAHLTGGEAKVSGKFAPSIELASVSDPLIIEVQKHHPYRRKRHSQFEEGAAIPPKEVQEKDSPLEDKIVHTEGLGLGLPPYAGKISIEGMDWNSSLTGVLLAKILSPAAWNAVDGDLHDISINGAVSLQDGVIGFGNVQGKSEILTGTMVGNINLKKEKIDLGGTLSPDYYWNSSPGHLPSFLGYIFSPQKGSGILAMGYTLDGDLSQPHFNLNPYMMLFPGILRKIANPNL